MRGTSTAHEGSSLMAGGGAVYLNFDTDDGEISPNPSMSIEKHDEVQCSIPWQVEVPLQMGLQSKCKEH